MEMFWVILNGFNMAWDQGADEPQLGCITSPNPPFCSNLRRIEKRINLCYSHCTNSTHFPQIEEKKAKKPLLSLLSSDPNSYWIQFGVVALAEREKFCTSSEGI